MTYGCEICGHRDALCWRFPFSQGMEVSYTTFEELKLYQPELAAALMNAPLNEKNPIREVVVGFCAYGLWKSGYVRRRQAEIWKFQGWRGIPMEKADHKGKKKKKRKKK